MTAVSISCDGSPATDLTTLPLARSNLWPRLFSRSGPTSRPGSKRRARATSPCSTRAPTTTRSSTSRRTSATASPRSRQRAARRCARARRRRTSSSARRPRSVGWVALHHPNACGVCRSATPHAPPSHAPLASPPSASAPPRATRCAMSATTRFAPCRLSGVRVRNRGEPVVWVRNQRQRGVRVRNQENRFGIGGSYRAASKLATVIRKSEFRTQNPNLEKK